MRGDLRARLVWLAAAGLLAGAGAAWIVSNAGPVRASIPNVPFALPVAVPVGWSLIGSGLLAWRSGVGDRLGAADATALAALQGRLRRGYRALSAQRPPLSQPLTRRPESAGRPRP
jgi:hypothetical protein